MAADDIANVDGRAVALVAVHLCNATAAELLAQFAHAERAESVAPLVDVEG